METDAAAVWDGVTNNGGSGRRRQLSSPLQAPPPADRRAVMDKNSETAGNALRRLSSSCQLDYYGADRRVDMRRISGLSGSFHGLDTADVPDVPVSGLVGEEGFVAVMTMDLKDAPRRRDRANSWDSTHHSRSSGILAEFEDELSRSGASGLVSLVNFDLPVEFYRRLGRVPLTTLELCVLDIDSHRARATTP